MTRNQPSGRSQQTRLEHRTGSRHGFTLLELLAASILTALLMAAVLRSLQTSFAVSSAAESHTRASVQLLIEQIERDVMNARGLRSTQQQTTLAGSLATDPTFETTTLQRAVVVYRVQDGQLLRIEQSSDGQTRTDVLWVGVAQFAMLGGTIEDGPVAIGPPSPDLAGLPAIGGRVIVQMTDASGRRLIDRTIVRDPGVSG